MTLLARKDPALEAVSDLFKDTVLGQGWQEFHKETLRCRLEEETFSLVDTETPSTDELERYYERDYWTHVQGMHFGKDPDLTSWEEVRNMYYSALRDVVINDKVQEFIEELDSAIASFTTFVESETDTSIGIDDEPNVGKSCPYGWAVHSYEKMYDDYNFYVWANNQVDGLNAVAVEVNGIWLFYAWKK